MAGFALAMLGGALKGYGEGGIEEIKAQREMKLRQLELDRTEQMQTNRMNFDREQNASERESREMMAGAQLKATQENTAATLSMQEKIANLNEGGATTRTKMTIDADAGKTDKMIEANKQLQLMQEEAAQKLNTKQVIVNDKAGNRIVKYQKPDGEFLPQPTDDEGNELTYEITTEDSSEMKSVKGLMQLGVSREEAMDKVFNAKNANRELAEAGIFKSIVDGMSTMKNLQDEDFDFAKKKARDITDGIYGGAEAPAAPAAPAAGDPAKPNPAVPTSGAETTGPDLSAVQRPKDMTDEQIVQSIKADPKFARKSPRDIQLLLKALKVDPSVAAAAGL